MKGFRMLNRNSNFTLTATVLATIVSFLAACGKAPTAPAGSTEPAAPVASSPSAEEPLFMFVHVAEDLVVDEAAATLRLVNVGQQTLFFSDRPDRIAGHLKMDAYLDEWTDKAGKDNFSANPPNAALSVYEPGQPDNTVAVVEITNPQTDGTDLIYNYRLIDGSLPASGGETCLFIDRIGVGGGVGVGYHGVGVGARGPGVR